jgi:hypothetical protein
MIFSVRPDIGLTPALLDHLWSAGRAPVILHHHLDSIYRSYAGHHDGAARIGLVPKQKLRLDPLE